MKRFMLAGVVIASTMLSIAVHAKEINTIYVQTKVTIHNYDGEGGGFSSSSPNIRLDFIEGETDGRQVEFSAGDYNFRANLSVLRGKDYRTLSVTHIAERSVLPLPEPVALRIHPKSLDNIDEMNLVSGFGDGNRYYEVEFYFGSKLK